MGLINTIPLSIRCISHPCRSAKVRRVEYVCHVLALLQLFQFFFKAEPLSIIATVSHITPSPCARIRQGYYCFSFPQRGNGMPWVARSGRRVPGEAGSPHALLSEGHLQLDIQEHWEIGNWLSAGRLRPFSQRWERFTRFPANLPQETHCPTRHTRRTQMPPTRFQRTTNPVSGSDKV